MRRFIRTLLVVLVVGSSCVPSFAAEEGAKWWHFGRKKEEASAAVPPVASDPTAPATTPIGVDPPATATTETESLDDPEEKNWMIKSPFGKVSWPRFQMPGSSEQAVADQPVTNAKRNAWAEPGLQDAEKPSTMKRLSKSTKETWKKTKAAFSPEAEEQEPSPSSRVAKKEPSMWDRMFGKEEPAKKDGSQTVSEFIAQDRIDP